MPRINASIVIVVTSFLITCAIAPRVSAMPQDDVDSAAPFQPRYVEVDEFNMGPPWLFDRREPSPGLLNSGYYDPHTIYRHHGSGTGTTQHYDGPYRHHDMGHAYYDDPASMKRFHGLGEGGAKRRGQYDYRRYFIEKYWYERGSSWYPCVPFVPSPPAHEPGVRDNSASFPPATQPVRPPIFFYEPPGAGGEEIEPIPLEEIPDRTWVMLNAGDAQAAMVLFAIEAARASDDAGADAGAKVGFAIANAMSGKCDRAAIVMRDALEVDGDALNRPEIGPALRSRIAALAAGLQDDDGRVTTCDGVLIASLHALGGQIDQAKVALALVSHTKPDDAVASVLSEFLVQAETRRVAMSR